MMNEQASVNGPGQQAFVPAGAYATGVGGRRVLWPVAIGAASVVVAASKLLTLIGSILQLGFSIVQGGRGQFSWIFGVDLWGMAA